MREYEVKERSRQEMKNYRILIDCQPKKSVVVIITTTKNTSNKIRVCFCYCCCYLAAYQCEYNETNYFRSSVSQTLIGRMDFIQIFFIFLVLAFVSHSTTSHFTVTTDSIFQINDVIKSYIIKFILFITEIKEQ